MRKEYIDALQLLDNVLMLEPGAYMSRPTVNRARARAHFFRGFICSEEGVFSSALDEYERATRLDGSLAEAYYNAAMTLTNFGDKEEADAYLEELRVRSPEHADRVERILRQIEAKRERDLSAIVDALRQYMGGTRQEAEEAFEQYQEGLALYKTGEFGKALYHFGAAVEIAPKFDSAHLYIGLCYYGLGRMDAAVAYLEKKGRDLPKSFLIRLMLGKLYLAEEKLEDAENAFKTALTLNPRAEEAHLDLSQVYWKQGDFSKAQDILEAALKVFPKSARIKERLRVMELREQWTE
jgi:tetratricopeptide (TPR) repeat protein